MTAPVETVAASPAESSGSTGSTESTSPFTLGAEISALMGGGFSDHSSAESPSDAGGAPPPASTEPPAAAAGSSPPEAGAPSEQPQDAEHAGAPPAVAASETAPPASDEELLKDAKPLTYIVNGETRAFEGITALSEKAGGGAFITPEHLPKLQQRLSERDHYYEKDQANHQRFTQLDAQHQALTKLSEWPVGKDAQGKDQFVAGADAIEARNVLIGQQAAQLKTLVAALDNPETFRALVDVRMDEQGQVFVFPNAQVLKSLITESKLAAMETEKAVRSAFGQMRGSLATTAQTPPRQDATAPANVTDVSAEQALSTVESIIQSQGIAGLTAEDKQYLAKEVLPRFIRATEPAERAQFGPRVVDHSFVNVVRREAEHRTQLSKTATNAQSAAQFNSRQLAAAAVGTPRNGQLPPTRPAAPKPSNAEETEDAKWAMLERLAGRA